MILIGPALRQALAAVSCYCDLGMDWNVVAAIERDSQENQVDAKQYTLFNSPRVTLTATVDEYEPETVTLALVPKRCKAFDSIVRAAAEAGFGQRPFFFDRPVSPPKQITESIIEAHEIFQPTRPFLRMSAVAVLQTGVICRCFLRRTGLRPTPYLIYKVNVPTLNANKLEGDDAKPFLIQGYR